MIDAWPRVRGESSSESELQGQYPTLIIIYGETARRSSLVANFFEAIIKSERGRELLKNNWLCDCFGPPGFGIVDKSFVL